MSKVAQIRALGLKKFEAAQGKPAKTEAKPIKVAKAKSLVENIEAKPAKTSPKSPSPKKPIPNSASPKSAADRNARWREKNREKYNASQKVLMQRKAKGQAEDKGDG